MGVNEYLAEELVSELAARNQRVGLDLAKLVVLVRTYDAFVRDYKKVYPKMSTRKIAATFKVSVRFLEITLVRYGLNGMAPSPGRVGDRLLGFPCQVKI